MGFFGVTDADAGFSATRAPKRYALLSLVCVPYSIGDYSCYYKGMRKSEPCSEHGLQGKVDKAALLVKSWCIIEE